MNIAERILTAGINVIQVSVLYDGMFTSKVVGGMTEYLFNDLSCIQFDSIYHDKCELYDSSTDTFTKFERDLNGDWLSVW